MRTLRVGVLGWQPGRILVLQPGASTATVFLDLTAIVFSGGERGLLGLAFHPDYAVNRRFFVNDTRQTDGATVIAEYQTSATNPDVADTADTVLLAIAQPFENPNGGMIEFGPDSFLYIGMGDGGSAAPGWMLVLVPMVAGGGGLLCYGAARRWRRPWPAMRIVAWNIRAGGGRRAEAIARQLARWRPDIVALSEFRATAPSRALAAALSTGGLTHQLTSGDRARPSTNALLIAARWPLRRVRLRAAPREPCRWLAASIAAPRPLALGSMHVPNRAGGRKYPFLDAVLACARRWRRGPALLLGDTNSGRRGIDEQVATFNAREEGWIDALAACGWPDGFRHLQTDVRAYTWYSPSRRNGFRIDQAFVNVALVSSIEAVTYTWGGAARGERRDVLSDHAALLVDVADR